MILNLILTKAYLETPLKIIETACGFWSSCRLDMKVNMGCDLPKYVVQKYFLEETSELISSESFFLDNIFW